MNVETNSAQRQNKEAEFDLCVIGGGPGGFAAVSRAIDFGKRVCLIDHERLGGVGVSGALASKTMWELSKDYSGALATDRGFKASNVVVSFDEVNACVAQATQERADQLHRQIELHSSPREGKPGLVTYIKGAAKFIDAHRVSVHLFADGDDKIISAKHIVIATGSRPREIDMFQVDGAHILTSDHVSKLHTFPKSLVIVGAGVVGCEYATIFANYGKTKVYLIDRADRILPFEDEDVACACATHFAEKNVTIHSTAQLTSLQTINGGVEYTLKHPDGSSETIQVEKALVAIGRVPNTEGLGLECAGVRTNSRGYIETSCDTQTSVPHIHAIGDVTYDVALVNVAEMEGRHAVTAVFDRNTHALSYTNLSTIMFLDPEVAAVGMNELGARKARLPYRAAVYGLPLVARPIAMRATSGFIKLLVTDDDEMRVIGMRALGVHASTTIELVSMMIQHGIPVRELARLLHPHPAVTEGVQECARMLIGTSILKPEAFPQHLRCSRVTYSKDGHPQEIHL